MKHTLTASRFAELLRSGFRVLKSQPWLLGYALIIQPPFQGVLNTHWALSGNLLTLAIVAAFFSIVFLPGRNPWDLLRATLGTRTQQLYALFILALTITMIWGDHSFAAFVALGQRIFLLLIVAIVVETVRREDGLSTLSWMALGAVTLLYLAALVDFYAGIDVFALGGQWAGLMDSSIDPEQVRRSGTTLGTTAAARAFGTNRFVFLAILPCALGMGLIATSVRLLPKLVAGCLVAVLFYGVIISGSRSGILVIATVFPTVILLNARSIPTVVNLSVASLAIFASVFLTLQIIPSGATAIDRLIGGRVEERYEGYSGLGLDGWRIRNWRIALEVFSRNPLGGIGFGGEEYANEVRARVPDAVVTDVHSGYLKTLSESGMLGMAPLLMLLAYTSLNMLKESLGRPTRATIWTSAFLTGFGGMLAANITATYLFERYLWVALAFAVVIEVRNRRRIDKIATASVPIAIDGPVVVDSVPGE